MGLHRTKSPGPIQYDAFTESGEKVRIVSKKTHAQSHLTVLRSEDGRRFRPHPTRGQLLVELADDVEGDGDDDGEDA
jgi:hypothetical protein